MANAYTVGDLLPFSLNIYNANGVLADGTNVSLTVILPDGTTAGPFAVSSTPTGVYNYVYATTMPGRHLGEWTSTGTNAGGEPQSFTVLPVAPLVTLGEVKAHLSIATSGDDDELAAFIAASVPILEGIAGPITPRTVVGETHDAGSQHIWTDFSPIISVSSLTEMVGFVQFTLTAQTIGGGGDNYGYTIDDAREGRITRRGVGNIAYPFGLIQDARQTTGIGSVLISYVAGRAQPSENIRMALKELLKYQWRQTHGGPSSFQEGFVSQAAVSGVSDAMMQRLRLILGPECVRPMGIA